MVLVRPQTAAATWRVLRALVCLLFSLGSYRSLTLFASSGVFLLFLFFRAPSFQVSATPPAGGARQFVSSIFLPSFPLSICLFCFCFCFCFLSFLYFHRMCMSCTSYVCVFFLPVDIQHNQYDDMALHCPLLCLLHTLVRGNVQYNSSISNVAYFVTT